MRLKSTEITELPNREILFLKKWQSNGFYPLEVAERNSDGWIVYPLVNGKKRGPGLTFTNKSFLYVLQNNLFLISDIPMENEHSFNYE